MKKHFRTFHYSFVNIYLTIVLCQKDSVDLINQTSRNT